MITILDVAPFLSRRRIITHVEGVGYYEARYPGVSSWDSSPPLPLRRCSYRVLISSADEELLVGWLRRAVGTVHDFGVVNLRGLGMPVNSEWASYINSNFPILGLKEACGIKVVPNIWLWTPDQFAGFGELFERNC